MKQIRREEGVSEVVGTILVLAITVVLFSAVFVYVSQIHRPVAPQLINVNSEIYFDGRSGILYENVTEVSGSVLSRDGAYLMVFINGTEASYPSSSLPITGPQGNETDHLGPGDTIHWNSGLLDVGVSANSSFKSELFYEPSNQVLWQSQNYALNEFSITSEYVTPFPVLPGKSFTLVIEISALDSSSLSVFVNLTSLFGNATNSSMHLFSSSGNQYTYYYSVVAPMNVPPGSHAEIYAISGKSSQRAEVDLS